MSTMSFDSRSTEVTKSFLFLNLLGFNSTPKASLLRCHLDPVGYSSSSPAGEDRGVLRWPPSAKIVGYSTFFLCSFMFLFLGCLFLACYYKQVGILIHVICSLKLFLIWLVNDLLLFRDGMTRVLDLIGWIRGSIFRWFFCLLVTRITHFIVILCYVVVLYWHLF